MRSPIDICFSVRSSAFSCVRMDLLSCQLRVEARREWLSIDLQLVQVRSDTQQGRDCLFIPGHIPGDRNMSYTNLYATFYPQGK